MGIGSHGAKNAALFAVRILALSDEGLRKKLHGFVEQQAAKVRSKDEAARKHYGA
jgi:phosphoribosylcarboxyaminoimidazole (NCAIR) mutase